LIEKAQIENDLEKGGEGSKGGKIIGHTKSGKPVYESSDHSKLSVAEHRERGSSLNSYNEGAPSRDSEEGQKNLILSTHHRQSILDHSTDKGEHIGRTESGKSIYSEANHPSHANFTQKDHKDAASLHQSLQRDQNAPSRDMEGSLKARHHYDQGYAHSEASKSKKNHNNLYGINQD